MARYRWPRGARGRLYLHGEPAKTDARDGSRTIPGHKSVVVEFGPPGFPPNQFETHDPWVDRAIQASELFRKRQIVLDSGVVAEPWDVLANEVGGIVRSGGGGSLPDEEPEWGAIELGGGLLLPL